MGSAVHTDVVAVVEDDAAYRTALGRLLRADGFATALFESAEAYLLHPPMPAPICVVMDVQLPGISGIDLQQQLRREPGAPPVIIATASRELSVRERAERNGCAAFFCKPFDGGALLSTIHTIASRPASR